MQKSCVYTCVCKFNRDKMKKERPRKPGCKPVIFKSSRVADDWKQIYQIFYWLLFQNLRVMWHMDKNGLVQNHLLTNHILLGMTHISMFSMCLVHFPVDRSIARQREESYLCMHMQERTTDREREGDTQKEREREGMEAITSVWASEVHPEAANINLHDPKHEREVYDKSAPLWLWKWNVVKGQSLDGVFDPHFGAKSFSS